MGKSDRRAPFEVRWQAINGLVVNFALGAFFAREPNAKLDGIVP
jgi:hypothetical protein